MLQADPALFLVLTSDWPPMMEATKIVCSRTSSITKHLISSLETHWKYFSWYFQELEIILVFDIKTRKRVLQLKSEQATTDRKSVV